MKQGSESVDEVSVKSTIKEHYQPTQDSDMEGEERQQSMKIGKGRINLPEGNLPVLSAQRDGAGRVFI